MAESIETDTQCVRGSLLHKGAIRNEERQTRGFPLTFHIRADEQPYQKGEQSRILYLTDSIVINCMQIKILIHVFKHKACVQPGMLVLTNEDKN